MDKGAYDDFIRNNSFDSAEFVNNQRAKEVAEEYNNERFRRVLEPKVLVSYSREPYIGAFNKNFRVTFDYNIIAQEGGSLFDVDLVMQKSTPPYKQRVAVSAPSFVPAIYPNIFTKGNKYR